jgi:hypothetical protein
MLMRKSIVTISALIVIAAASPAQSAGGISIPEPSDLSLFALGVVGLLVGRYAAKRRK